MAQADGTGERLRHHWPFFGGAITSSILLVGSLLVLFGAVLRTGVWAGMLGIIGGLLILVAVLSRTFVLLYERL